MSENNSNSQTYGYGSQTSSLAVISLIAGIASYFIVPLLGAIAAIITGNMAKKEIDQSQGRLTGSGMANWGRILGWINLALSLVGVCVGIVFLVLGLLTLFGGLTLPFFFSPLFEGGF
jgi:hypothetical protein